MTNTRKRRPSPHPRRTLELLDLLAISPGGATEALLVRIHGFNSDMIAGLLRAGLATTESRMIAGALPAEVVSIRITEAGQDALISHRAGCKGGPPSALRSEQLA
jgi:hypothetical protein